jgi:hypothetical protein
MKMVLRSPRNVPLDDYLLSKNETTFNLEKKIFDYGGDGGEGGRVVQIARVASLVVACGSFLDMGVGARECKVGPRAWF